MLTNVGTHRLVIMLGMRQLVAMIHIRLQPWFNDISYPCYWIALALHIFHFPGTMMASQPNPSLERQHSSRYKWSKTTNRAYIGCVGASQLHINRSTCARHSMEITSKGNQTCMCSIVPCGGKCQALRTWRFGRVLGMRKIRNLKMHSTGSLVWPWTDYALFFAHFNYRLAFFPHVAPRRTSHVSYPEVQGLQSRQITFWPI